MADNLPQYYENTLEPISLTKESLQHTADEFISYMRKAAKLIYENVKSPEKEDSSAYGTLFSGYLGTALGLTNVFSQIATIVDQLPEEGLFSNPLEEEINIPNPVPAFPLDLKPGRPSPLSSTALGATLLRFKEVSATKERDILNLKGAIEQALTQNRTVEMRGHEMGGDEVLYGRAGLLWGLLEISKQRFWTQKLGLDMIAADDEPDFISIVNESIPKLAAIIMQAGKEGAEVYKQKHGHGGAMPLMWSWIDDYYGLGAMHGITGILAVLLDRQIEMIDGSIKEHYPAIAETITALCNICMTNDGHLPMATPTWPSDGGRSSPLVQICHGTPGLLLLLAAAALNLEFSETYYKPEWIEAIYVGAQKVWEEGLLAKGGGLCHGVAGNAWTLLILHDCFEYNFNTTRAVRECSGDVRKAFLADDRSTGDWLLSRALAMLKECRNTMPFDDNDKYRMPDNPYSLFKGLAGTLSAWSEAVLAIQARVIFQGAIERGQVDFPASATQKVKMRWLKLLMDRLGFPGIGADFSFYKILLRGEIEKLEAEGEES